MRFVPLCFADAAHDVQQVLFNSRVDWNTVTWSETLPLALPPEPLVGKGAANHKVAAKTPSKAAPKMMGKSAGRGSAIKAVSAVFIYNLQEPTFRAPN